MGKTGKRERPRDEHNPDQQERKMTGPIKKHTVPARKQRGGIEKRGERDKRRLGGGAKNVVI